MAMMNLMLTMMMMMKATMNVIRKSIRTLVKTTKAQLIFFYQTRLQCFCPPIMMLLVHEYDDDVRGPAEMMMLPADIMTMMTRSQLKMMQ